MTDIINIPLNKLTAWKGNVRKTQSKAAIDELAASIKAHGLQQNLVVRKDGKQFAVVAGGRRLKALQELAKSGEIEPAHPVPCRITEAEDAAEISLAENVVRVDMHPADQFEAFRDLTDRGMPLADIAARFGKSEAHVVKLLKLARVSPKVLRAYRKEDLTLDDVMAFAVTNDHAAHERVLASGTPWQSAREIRSALTENDIPVTDKRVKFVTIKAYEKAGGTLKRDLFSDDEGSAYIEDHALLDTLVAERLEKLSAPVRAEGWKWVEACVDFGHDQSVQFKRIHAEPIPLTDAEQARLDVLQAEYEQLDDEWNQSGDDDAPQRLVELESLIEEIEERDCVWTPEQRAIAGAVVGIRYDGKPDIDRGLVKPEDVPKGKAKRDNAGTAVNSGDSAKPEFDGLPSALVESLTAQKSAAISAELLRRPDVALAAVVHAFASAIVQGSPHRESALEVGATAQALRGIEGAKALKQLDTAGADWRQRLPKPEDLWAWCLEQERKVLLDLLAYCAAMTVDAVMKKNHGQTSARIVHADLLASALGLDMKAWFTPTAENFFGSIPKAQILAALTEARKQPFAPAWEKLKKPELATVAEREIAGTGWLPLLLRP